MKSATVNSTSALNFQISNSRIRIMILIFFLYLREILANNGFNGISIEKFGNGFIDRAGEKNYFGQPRFNASCDDVSLEAAAECEERVYSLVPNLILY